MSQAIWYNQWTLKKFKKYLSGDILEVGCGIGNFTNSLTKFGDVWAVDINPTYLKETLENVKGHAKIGYGDIEKGDYFFNDKVFDTVVCLNVLEHIKDDHRAISNLAKLIKSKGFLILLVPAFPNLYGEIDKAIFHFRRYNKVDIEMMIVKNNFSIRFIRVINLLGAIGWWFTGKVLKKNQVEKSKLRIFNFFAPLLLTIEDMIDSPIGTSLLIVAQKEQ